MIITDLRKWCENNNLHIWEDWCAVWVNGDYVSEMEYEYKTIIRIEDIWDGPRGGILRVSFKAEESLVAFKLSWI